MELDELRSLVASGDIETVIIAMTDMQGRLVGKRLTARHFLGSGGDGIGTCSVVLGWGHDHALDPGYDLTGWANGYPDLVVRPDIATLRRYPWFEKTAFVLGDAVTPEGAPIGVAPRTILADMLQRLGRHGLRPLFASELECYLLDETPASAFDKGFVKLTTKHRTMHPETVIRTSEDEAYLGTLRRHMEAASVPVEMVKAEYAPGQIETNLEYADAMTAADRHMVFKTGAKEIALQQGLVAAFMAKLAHDLGGSSCHIHMSLVDSDGQSAFASGADGRGTSVTMRHFLGGLTAYLRDIFLFFAPTINSYKRLRPGTFAPATVTWGEDNRTVALRLIGKGPARRIENRIPGADVNPYLAYAGMIAAGLAGIEEKLEPIGAAATGNAYELKDRPALPASLEEAAAVFGNSKMVEASFGPAVQKHYANFGVQSVRSAAAVVTDYERRMLLLDI
ncbi:glutamine synthetase family protein [Paracoccus pacificus]|uniref:Glutamine synthetase family protein n=1 Tax=Paracoccus pacificus TaxID=1463598 RepID=A0ABW4RCQ1_9RHOB